MRRWLGECAFLGGLTAPSRTRRKDEHHLSAPAARRRGRHRRGDPRPRGHPRLIGHGGHVFQRQRPNVGANSGLIGIGLSIEHLHPANVIVRNLHISGVTAESGDGDAIHIQDADHIWIDHNTLSSDLDHGTDYYDGLLDATRASDNITASWNHLATHIKGSLLGHDDDNAAEDTGHLRVTYHHNWFDRTMERNPRIRFGDPVHIYDNLYSNITGSDDYYGIASTQDAGALVEDNVFENVVQACWSASGYADSGPGRLVARNNQLVNSGPCETNGTVAAIPYAYTLEDVGTVKASVTAGAGAGHL